MPNSQVQPPLMTRWKLSNPHNRLKNNKSSFWHHFCDISSNGNMFSEIRFFHLLEIQSPRYGGYGSSVIIDVSEFVQVIGNKVVLAEPELMI